MNAISLFSGAMGLDLGIEKAGFKPGVDISIAMDIAASEFYNKETKYK